MAEPSSRIVERINRLTTAGHRGNLVARGLARGMVWRDGALPPGAPTFSEDLTTDLLDHGFQLLSSSLSLRAAEGDMTVVRRRLYGAAESLESAARFDGRTVAERGFYLTMAAAAFHIGGYAARAYSLFEGSLSEFNLSSCEKALVYLMRRNLAGLRRTFTDWLTDENNSDEAVLARLQGAVVDAADTPVAPPASPAVTTAADTPMPEAPAPDADPASAQDVCPNCEAATGNLQPSGYCSEWCEQEVREADRRRNPQPPESAATAPPAPVLEGDVPAKKMSALDAAAKILAETGRPMNCQELIGAMAAKGYWTSPGGKTPHSTLYAAMGKEIATKGEQSRFVKADRGKFALAR
jgi:hypothetical protein